MTFFGKIYTVTSWGYGRARQTLSQILPALPPSGVLLDVGSGLGHVSSLLMGQGYSVTSLDVRERSKVKEIATVIYDGTTIPFDKGYFDAALLLTVLHHAQDPKALLEEALRVAHAAVIIEDVYYTNGGKYLTYFIDSLLNWEWVSHPHTNKTEAEWKALFRELDAEVVYEDRWFSLIGGVWPIRQVLFKIRKKDANIF